MEGESPGGNEPRDDASAATERTDATISDAVIHAEEELRGEELDHVFDALADPRRRYLLDALEADAEWSLRELATRIAALERDVPEETVREHERQRVYVALYHVHVPKLVDLGAVTFDAETETIAPGEHAAQVLATLEGIDDILGARRGTRARSDDLRRE